MTEAGATSSTALAAEVRAAQCDLCRRLVRVETTGSAARTVVVCVSDRPKRTTELIEQRWPGRFDVQFVRGWYERRVTDLALRYRPQDGAIDVEWEGSPAARVRVEAHGRRLKVAVWGLHEEGAAIGGVPLARATVRFTAGPVDASRAEPLDGGVNASALLHEELITPLPLGPSPAFRFVDPDISWTEHEVHGSAHVAIADLTVPTPALENAVRSAYKAAVEARGLEPANLTVTVRDGDFPSVDLVLSGQKRVLLDQWASGLARGVLARAQAVLGERSSGLPEFERSPAAARRTP